MAKLLEMREWIVELSNLYTQHTCTVFRWGQCTYHFGPSNCCGGFTMVDYRPTTLGLDGIFAEPLLNSLIKVMINLMCEAGADKDVARKHWCHLSRWVTLLDKVDLPLGLICTSHVTGKRSKPQVCTWLQSWSISLDFSRIFWAF